MASKYNKNNKYHIGYKINGIHTGKTTGLAYIPANEAKAEAIRKKIAALEKENKLKIKYGAIIPNSYGLKMSLSEAASKYLLTIKKTNSKGKQDNHSRTFEVVMRQFQLYTNPNTEVSKINQNNIRTFVDKKKNEMTTSSVQTYIRYLKGFFNYLVEEEIIEKSPIVKRLIPKSESKPINTFREEDINLILKSAEELDPEYSIIYEFLLLTGIRPGDIFGICAGNFNFEKKILQLKISKTNRTIEYPIFEVLEGFINDKLPGIKTMHKNERVFKKYSVERIGKTFRKIIKKLNLNEESYNLKTFRKTFASTLADKGIMEGDLADLLGHTSTTTTRNYYKSKNAGAVRGRIDALSK